jgi:t-SNARE complex subunit (syntaxin)
MNFLKEVNKRFYGLKNINKTILEFIQFIDSMTFLFTNSLIYHYL